MRLRVLTYTWEKDISVIANNRENATERDKKKINARIKEIVNSIQKLSEEFSELQLEIKSLEDSPLVIQEGSIVTIKNNYKVCRG